MRKSLLTALNIEDGIVPVLPKESGSEPISLRKRSPFKAAMCREDLQHIKAIQATNVDKTPPQKLIGIFYKAVTKPVQGRIMRSYHFAKTESRTR